jgi:hypothetical protein
MTHKCKEYRENAHTLFCPECNCSDAMRVGFDSDAMEILVMCVHCDILLQVFPVPNPPDTFVKQKGH